MKAKIKSGSGIMHDQFFGNWPGCYPPISEYHGEKYQYRAKDPDMLFDVEWKDSANGGYWNCIAPGYGKAGDYGNGSIFVHGVDGVEKITDKIEKMKHIDEWLDTPTFDKSEIYAKFVLDYFRMPAWKIMAYSSFMKQFKLFCTHNGQRYRCTGASRMGDIWLTPDFDQDTGYKLRVDVTECSNWNSSPEIKNEDNRNE